MIKTMAKDSGTRDPSVDGVTRRGALLGGGALVLGGLAGYRVAAGTTQGSPPRRIVGTRSQAAIDAARQHATTIIHVLDFDARGAAIAGHFSDPVTDQLRRRDDVRYVEPDIVHRIPKPPDRPTNRGAGGGQSLPWGVDRVDAEVVHDDGKTGNGASIAILDTGIDSDHPDLEANLGTGKAIVSCTGSKSVCKAPWDDDNGHGTHCAGTANASDNDAGVVGVSTRATLHAVKVLNEDGSGRASDIAAGINWVRDQGYHVASMSLGSNAASKTIRDACIAAHDQGVLLVAAAGNSGSCSNCVKYPAAFPEVVAVSATTKSDESASWSSTGPEVELAAPGSDIPSTSNDGGYRTMSGTSMACPHVSGAGGQLMASGGGGLTNTAARDRLRKTAEQLPGLTPEEQGSGLLDVENAVLGTRNGNDFSS